MKEAFVYGKKQPITASSEVGEYSTYEVVEEIQLEKTRSDVNRIDLKFEENDIVELKFSDNTQWIGLPEDVTDIYESSASTRSTRARTAFVFEHSISQNNPKRGGIAQVIVKTLRIIRAKDVHKLSKDFSRELAIKHDNRAMPQPGLFKLDENFESLPLKKLASKNAPYLVLLHGTLSSTYEAFKELHQSENGIWKELHKSYPAGVVALDHKTISVSPLENALDFLEKCEDGTKMDILSHSRGGLVADIIAKCDKRNQIVGFSETELQMMKREDKAGFEIMNSINRIAKTKGIEVRKVIRVAAPSSGTTVLSKRIDHFLNLTLNALGLAIGGNLNFVYKNVKTFLLEVVRYRADAAVMPGLHSMVPDSSFQKLLNYAENPIAGDLYVVAGNAELGGGMVNSLKVILTNLFYWKANDLVVDSSRMKHGVPRTAGLYHFLSKDGSTNHFNYFKNKNTNEVILEAVKATSENQASKYEWISLTGQAGRGVVLDWFSMKGVHYDEISGKRRVAIILPGIMGSSLDADNESQWIDFRELNRGAIREKLAIGIEGVEVNASGVIKKFYDGLIKHLQKTHDVLTFPFDWRNSVKDAAVALAKKIDSFTEEHAQPIHIVAHSMGGLVARQVMIDHPETWKNFNLNPENKFMMLGTPWLGSYLIMEVLTGHSSRVKQLAMMDFKHTKSQLMDVFRKYPGIYELLPIDGDKDRDFGSEEFWKGIQEIEGDKTAITDKQTLNGFRKFQQEVKEYLENSADKTLFDNIYYVAGLADQTVYDYTTKKRFLSRKEKLVYLATNYGDGSVTWDTGIPKKIKKSNLYYTRTSHGELACDEENFEGISEILLTGKTARLLFDKPVAREGELISEVLESPEPMHDVDVVSNLLFGVQPKRQPEITPTTPFNVQVINGDLKIASYPVMVGHFYNDGIFSAEKALDNYLDKRLSQRHAMGYYPGKIGESEVFFNLNTNPKGAIICGLGNSQELTHFLLAKTVEMASLKYAMFMRDNYTLPRAKKYAQGISFILIGVGYGQLQIENSISGILLGVSNANRFIKEKGDGLREITEIELINYYESYASQAYWSLSRLQNADNRYHFNLIKGVEAREGARKRRAFVHGGDEWWHNFNITSIQEMRENEDRVTGFAFQSSSGLARIEREEVHNAMSQIEGLLEELSQSTSWNAALSKTLFELLIPNPFKDIIRNQNNLVLKLDLHAAQFPWEMFHDSDIDPTPAVVNSGLVRQLATSDYEHIQLRAPSDKALVIGDPKYGEEGLVPLPVAKKEAQQVAGVLKDNGYETVQFINAESSAIMLGLYTDQYKLLHFAGHGLFEPEKGRVGIAIGNGICLDPAMLKQMSYVPEFVFINCCFSGKTATKYEALYRSRYKLAANVGTQLIKMGVKAIIVTGWAVDDGAAGTFSDVFYRLMTQGYEFGVAVQMARKACYQNHRHTNTWGAYQCYGNQHYTFHDRMNKKKEDYDYVLNSQVYTDLDNLYSSIKHQRTNKNSDEFLEKLEQILENAERNDLIDGAIREKQALIYDEIGKPDQALEIFRSVLSYEEAVFSVKVLEHFCLLSSLNLPGGDEEALLKGKKPTAKEIDKRLEENKKRREMAMEKITNLPLVGATTLRLGIVGNAHKLCSLHEKGQTRLKRLRDAYDSYEEAYKLNPESFCGPSLDAFSNLVFLGILLEKNDPVALYERLHNSEVIPSFDRNASEAGQTEEEAIRKFLIDELEKREKELDDHHPDDKDISVLLGITEMIFCQLLIGEGNEEEQVKKILERFEETFHIYHSSRQIRMEIKQLEFLMDQDVLATKVPYLKRVKTALEKQITD